MSITQPSQAAGRMAPYGKLPVPHFTPELLALIKTGTVHSLSMLYWEGMLVPGPMVPYTISPRIRHGDLKDIVPASAAAEVITMSAHTGTHIDALCHVGEFQDADGAVDLNGDVRLYAGEGQTVSAADHITHTGQQHLSIAEMPPIVTRAVMLDIAGYHGVSVLPDNTSITAADIRGTLEKQETEIRPGTAVLLRTGFAQHLLNNTVASRDAISGINLEAAQYLVSQGMILAGADTMSVEVFPPFDHAVHRFLLVHNGITHLENVYLEELAAQQVYECVLTIAPLRLIGSTGSWVHPLAFS